MVISRPIALAVGTPTVSVVVPIFNEEATVGELYRRLKRSLDSLGVSFELILVNDGSRDGSTELLNDLAAGDSRMVVVHLSRNFGHQAAVTAGPDHAHGECVIIMDGDLQDPPEVLAQLIEQWRAGYDVVYAVRTKRKEHWPKRTGYFLFYRLMRATTDFDIPLDSGDFGLMDRKVVDAMRQLPEHERFVRGLRSFVGFRQIGVTYERHARAGGETKYSLRKLITLAMDGLIGFSAAPLTSILYLGVAAFVAASGMMIALLRTVVLGQEVSGWMVTLASVLFLGAIQLLSLSIVGQYIQRMFWEVKGRPTYVVREVRTASRTRLTT